MILLIATLGGFLVTFMASSVNIALPLIGEEFQASTVMLSWISMSMILVSGAILLPVGRLADTYGRVRFFIFSMVLFTVALFASAFAPSAWFLLGMRALTGVSLAIGSVTSTALVILAYPVESRGKALGLNIGGVYLGLTAGPILGGLIVHNLGWRALFLIVGAFALLDVILPVWKLRHLEWKEAKKAPFDLAGSIIYAVSLTSLLLGFSWLPGTGGLVLVPLSLAGLAGFVWWESRAADPLLPVSLLRNNRVFAFTNGAVLVNYAATSAMIFLMSLYLQYIRGLNAQTAGLVLVCGTFVQAVMSPVAGRLADRVPARYVATTGMILCVAGLFALVFLGETTPYWYIILALIVLGFGFALFSTPATHVVMGSVDRRLLGVASATIAAVRQAGMSLSTGVAALMLAVLVGRKVITGADYPALLTSIQLTFLIFTVLCVIGVGMSLVGPGKGEQAPAGD
jgi:MFS family permease